MANKVLVVPGNMRGWISVKQELPPCGEWRDLGDEDEPFMQRSSDVVPVISGRKIRFACFDDDGKNQGWTDVETHHEIKVTHWYELPIPEGIKPNRFGGD